MGFQAAIRELQDTLVVVAEIQRRQAAVQKLQAEEVDALRQLVREGFEKHEKRMAHIDERLSEVADKLDGMIGFMGGQFKGPQ